MKNDRVLLESDLDSLKLIQKGKVRDLYEIDEDKILIVQTDRVSAFDKVFPNGIANKGVFLTKISSFWFKFFNKYNTHYIDESAERYLSKSDYLKVKERCFVAKKHSPLQLESIVRGYLSGSAWKSYEQSGKINGQVYEKNLKKNQKLPKPIFTPSTKAKLGEKDINISDEALVSIFGEQLKKMISELSIKIFIQASEYAKKRGVIIVDTKFEFALSESNLVIIDEIFTPDSSRFWIEGQDKIHYDKQLIRDWLISIKWSDKEDLPGIEPNLSKIVINSYKKIHDLLT
ncbi:MAG: phosphoribosylaminoimidazolesuccinocarboxamide synthase [Hydrogenophilales bacterium]